MRDWAQKLGAVKNFLKDNPEEVLNGGLKFAEESMHLAKKFDLEPRCVH